MAPPRNGKFWPFCVGWVFLVHLLVLPDSLSLSLSLPLSLSLSLKLSSRVSTPISMVPSSFQLPVLAAVDGHGHGHGNVDEPVTTMEPTTVVNGHDDPHPSTYEYRTDVDVVSELAGLLLGGGSRSLSLSVLRRIWDDLELRRDPERSEAVWVRWMRSVPAPTVVDLTRELFGFDGSGTPTTRLEGEWQWELRMILLPSGTSVVLHDMADTDNDDTTVDTVLVNVLYGALMDPTAQGRRGRGRGRGRGDGNEGMERNAGDTWEMERRREGRDPQVKSMRSYVSLDRGPAAVLELVRRSSSSSSSSSFSETKTISKGTQQSLSNNNNNNDSNDIDKGNTRPVRLTCVPWDLRRLLGRRSDLDGGSTLGTEPRQYTAYDAALSMAPGSERNDMMQKGLNRAVGGLGPQIDTIVRRVLDGRAVAAASSYGNDDDDDDDDETTTDRLQQREAEELLDLGLTPVRGLLLYGPPGCGKTALAREIAVALGARRPKVVAAPELLDRWVGGSEQLVRDLFVEAEAELRREGPEGSALHVIVVDEIDAVFRTRSSSVESGGEATRSSAVNQLLAKLDGVDALPNVLLVGMTNRRELLDPALLRPGRLEVQVEVPLPDRDGRREILHIHTHTLRRNGRLSPALCDALDGSASSSSSTSTLPMSLSSLFHAVPFLQRWPHRRGRPRRELRLEGRTVDLADDSVTGGFSGADLAGLIRCAGSIALARVRRQQECMDDDDNYNNNNNNNNNNASRKSGLDGLCIELEDVRDALQEVQA